jgi:hypothetical protein
MQRKYVQFMRFERSGTGVPPVNHAQDARATGKLLPICCGNSPCLLTALRGKKSQAGNIAPVILAKSDSGTLIALGAA